MKITSGRDSGNPPGLFHLLVRLILSNPVKTILLGLFLFIVISIIGALLMADWITVPY
ncbi:uncharacterized protein METZ01_LOCUS275170 [marine metagenome]|uniref:Uncharacterized protein n=1 Tax=marine metagenome TaxID=408172 RepID=A0A382KE76_9ZZZZ